MKFQLTCHTIPYTRDKLPLARAFAGIAAAGFDFVSLWRESPDGFLFKPGATHADVDQLRDTIASYGLQCRNAYFGQITGSAEVVEGLLEFVEHCAYAGIDQICAWGPSVTQPSPDGRQVPKPDDVWQKDAEGFYASMRKVLPEAEDAGVELLLKPHRGVGAAGESLRETYQILGSPAFGVCYDAGNVHFYEGIDPVEDVKLVADITTCFIAKEHVGPQGNPVFGTPGDGDLNLQSMLTTLARADFEGPVINERVDVLGAAKIDYQVSRAYKHLRAITDAVLREHSPAGRK